MYKALCQKINNLTARIKNTIRYVRITGGADNTLQFPVQQITYKDKVANALTVFPYGLYANMSVTESLALLFIVEGEDSNKSILGYTPKLRPKDLAVNEVALYHPFTETFIKLRNNGDLEINTIPNAETTGKVIVNCQNAEINVVENANIAVQGNVTSDIDGTLTATVMGDVQLTAEANFTGDITGNLDINVTGDITADCSEATITTSGDTNINSSGNTIITAPQVELKGTATNILTTGSINPLTGTPFPNGNPNLLADA